MQEMPILPWWFTPALALWAAIGPLAGILIGHYLARSWQREQRSSDNQKDEYKSVLASLNRLNMMLIEQHSNGGFDVQKIKPLMEEVTVALNTSLFIMDFLVESKAADDVLD